MSGSSNISSNSGYAPLATDSGYAPLATDSGYAPLGPHAGLRVLDLSDRLSGAYAARIFGDFGADVVLVEPAAGHPLRHEPPCAADATEPSSAIHAYANWNKRSVIYADDEQLSQLIANADVVITTSHLASDDALNTALAALPAASVHLSVTAHGLSGPLAGTPGNNLTTSARTGWSYINRYRDEPALQMPRHQTGYVGGLCAYTAAAAALLRRHATVAAEQVDVSELEAFALTVHPWGVAAVYEGRGRSNGPAGGRPRGAAGPLWDLADGRMNFGLADFHHWPDAMAVLGVPELGKREELIPDLGRHSKDMTDVVAGLAKTLPTLERWPTFHALAKLRCVIGVMQDIADLGDDQQLAARDFLVPTTVAGRSVRTAGPIAKMHPAKWQLRRSAPALGEQTQATVAGQWREQTKASQQTADATQPPATKPSPAGPLAGIRVLSFGQAWSGTFGTELLALLGADVIQIGALHRPDVWRRTSANVPAGLRRDEHRQHALNTQGLYNSVNLNKRELTLDLRSEQGRDLFWRLLPRFDVLADNFRPNVMPSWGVSLEKLHELRPGMIWASISGYGATGPYAQYPANGATTEPMAGLSSIHGYAGDPGMNTGGLFPDPVSGYTLAAGILAALHERDRTGAAQRVDLAMMEAIASVCGDAFIEYGITGELPQPHGNQHPLYAPHNNYPAQNGEWLALAIESDVAWAALVQHVGDDRLADQRFATVAGRKAHEAELDPIVGHWTQQQDAAEAAATLAARGITAARVAPLYELYSKPDHDFLAADFITEIDHPEAGPTWLPGRPWRLSGAPHAPLRAAPCVGEHSQAILADELGITEAEYEALVAAGVTGTLDD